MVYTIDFKKISKGTARDAAIWAWNHNGAIYFRTSGDPKAEFQTAEDLMLFVLIWL